MLHDQYVPRILQSHKKCVLQIGEQWAEDDKEDDDDHKPIPKSEMVRSNPTRATMFRFGDTPIRTRTRTLSALASAFTTQYFPPLLSDPSSHQILQHQTLSCSQAFAKLKSEFTEQQRHLLSIKWTNVSVYVCVRVMVGVV